MNTNPRNYQPTLVLGGFAAESVPANDWRAKIAAGEPVPYYHDIRGNAVLECEDGAKRSVQVEIRFFGKKRLSALGGIVASWMPRPSRGSVHAQTKNVTLADGSISFEGGTPVYTESDLVAPDGSVHSPEKGLVYRASLAKGKTLAFTDAELELRPFVSNGETKLSVTIRHHNGVAVIDRPAVADLDDETEAPTSKETATVRQAARKTGTQASPAQSEAGVFGGAV